MSGLVEQLRHLIAVNVITRQDIALAGAGAIVLAGVLIKTIGGDRLENDRLSKLGWLIAIAGLALLITTLTTWVNPNAL